MNVEAEIEHLNGRIVEIVKRIIWFKDNAEKLKLLPDGRAYFSGNDVKVDFDRLDHASIIKVVRTLGGKWKKTINSAYADRVDYESVVGGINVRCWAGKPPPSCKLVEVEEFVPAQNIPARTIKRLKMICQDAEPVAIAVATANASAHDATKGQSE